MSRAQLWYTLTHHWDFARILRLTLGLMMFWQGVLTQQGLVILFSTVFVGLALFSLGACSSGSCAPSRTSSAANTQTDEVDFEEIQ